MWLKLYRLPNELVFFVCFVSGFICINLVAQAVLPGRSGVSTSCHAQGLSQRALVFAQAVPHKVRSESMAHTAGTNPNNKTLPRMSPDSASGAAPSGCLGGPIPVHAAESGS